MLLMQRMQVALCARVCCSSVHVRLKVRSAMAPCNTSKWSSGLDLCWCAAHSHEAQQALHRSGSSCPCKLQ